MRNQYLSFLCGFLTTSVTFSLLLTLASCSTPTSRQRIDAIRDSSRHSPAADYMDAFWLDYRSPPDKPVRHWEFYYKHCAVDDQKPFPDNAEWMCTSPY